MSWARRTFLTLLDINRETVVPNYTSNRPFPANYDFVTINSWNYCVPLSTLYSYRGFSFAFIFPSAFSRTLCTHTRAREQSREKAEGWGRKKDEGEGKLAEHRIEYRHSLNYFLVVCWWSMMKINLDPRCAVVRLTLLRRCAQWYRVYYTIVSWIVFAVRPRRRASRLLFQKYEHVFYSCIRRGFASIISTLYSLVLTDEP